MTVTFITSFFTFMAVVSGGTLLVLVYLDNRKSRIDDGIAQALEKKESVPHNVNFGPEESLSVMELVNLFESAFRKKLIKEIVKSPIIESSFLSLDSSLAHQYYKWGPSLSPAQSIMQTAEWYLKFSCGEDAKSLMLAEISKYKVGKW